MDALYQEIILDHYRNPVGRGLLEPFDAEVHHVNPTCGDEITLRVRLAPGSDLVEVSYENQGCSISQAAASVMHEIVQGQPLSYFQARQAEFLALMHSATQQHSEFDPEALGDAMAFSGVAQYPARVKCALLPWMACAQALQQAAENQAAGNQVEAS
jgi:nitrogen fixation protein NifU and related proteins